MTRQRRARARLASLLALLLLAAAAAARGDNVRGTIRSVVALAVEPEFEQTVELRHSELAAVTLPADTRFLDGVRIELVMSAEARSHYDDFGLAVYDRLDAAPAPGFRALTGRRAFLHVLLPVNRLFALLAFGGQGRTEVDAAQGIFRLSEPARPSDFPILLTVLPIMKGVPDSLQGLTFYLKVRPIVRDAGEVSVRILAPAGDHRFTVLVDDAPVEGSSAARASDSPWEATLELPSGLHTLHVSSPTLQRAQAAFSVDPGGTSTVELSLRESAASLAIEAPRDAAVWLDGTKIDFPRESSVGLPAGEHTVRYRIGEYSGVRTFTAEQGKRYTIFVEMNVTVKED